MEPCGEKLTPPPFARHCRAPCFPPICLTSYVSRAPSSLNPILWTYLLTCYYYQYRMTGGLMNPINLLHYASGGIALLRDSPYLLRSRPLPLNLIVRRTFQIFRFMDIWSPSTSLSSTGLRQDISP